MEVVGLVNLAFTSFLRRSLMDTLSGVSDFLVDFEEIFRYFQTARNLVNAENDKPTSPEVVSNNVDEKSEKELGPPCVW